METDTKKSIPKIVFFTVCMGMFSAAIVFTVVFPFANEMMMTFGVTDDKSSTGYYVGLVATFLMIGRLISSAPWGYIIDIWGRRPVTLFALGTMIFFSTAFGFSTNIFWALSIRLLLGLFSPLMVSSKTIISELCKGEDISSSMAWITIAWNIGSIAGSFIGGVFSNPEEKGITSSGLFVEYPYLLPSIIPSVICLFTFCLTYIYLKETLVKKPRNQGAKNNNIKEIIMSPRVFPVVILYMISTFSFTAFQELITLFAWAKLDKGGLELSTTYIGYLLGGSNMILLLFQRQIYMQFVKKIGNIATSRIGFIMLTVTTCILPIMSMVSNDYIKIILLPALCVVWYLSDFMVHTSMLVLLNNSVHPSELGRVNGTTMSLNCFARMFAPASIGAVFAWTINSKISQPLNYSCTFYLLAIINLIAVAYTYKIFKENEKKYQEKSSEIALVEITEE